MKLKINWKNIKYIPRYLLTWFIGGHWEYGWSPSLRGKICKFYFENWNRAGYSLWKFIKPEIRNWLSIS